MPITKVAGLRAFATACLLAGCSRSIGARPLSAAELNAIADTEEARASAASSQQAAELHEIAAEHRSAARAIEASTAAICAGVPEEDRARPALFQAAAIEGVWPVMGERRLIKTTVQELRGAQLVVRGTQGMTKQWIARMVRCHLAWHETVGPLVREGFEDPLMVGMPEIYFDETETGFVVRIVGHDKREGEEILRRSRRIAEQP